MGSRKSIERDQIHIKPKKCIQLRKILSEKIVRVLIFKDKEVSHGEIHIFILPHTSVNTGLWFM